MVVLTTMNRYADVRDKPHHTTADVSIDARDVLAGAYDHIPLEVLRQ